MFTIPSIQALRIFETICRTGSFTKAAEELGVSQGAVSQHMKTLEVRVGFAVFVKDGRSVKLTESGHALLSATRDGLSVIAQCIATEKRKQRTNELVISIQPGIATRWLFPRLMDFNAKYPEINVSVNAVANPDDFALYHAHACLSYRVVEPGTEGGFLFREHLFPVASPAFAQQHDLQRDLSEAAILARIAALPLLGDQSPVPQQYGYTWRYWSRKMDVALPKDAIKRSTQSNITLQLAELGHGVALGRTSLVMDALHEGRLVQLTPARLINPCGYQLVRNPALARSESLQLFSRWLYQQAEGIEQFSLY